MREPRRGQVAWEGEDRDLDDYRLLRQASENSYTLVLLGSFRRQAVCDDSPSPLPQRVTDASKAYPTGRKARYRRLAVERSIHNEICRRWPLITRYIPLAKVAQKIVVACLGDVPNHMAKAAGHLLF